MNAAQVRKALKALELGGTAAAKLFQVTRMTVWQWKKDGTSGCNAILLRLLVARVVTVEDVEHVRDLK